MGTCFHGKARPTSGIDRAVEQLGTTKASASTTKARRSKF
jgi:hypothetical protein